MCNGRGCEYSRFIPACAGNTKHTRISAFKQSVHPRVCGEHKRVYLKVSSWVGSSPRVRGTQDAESLPSLLHRFIPAWAGNTKLALRVGDHCRFIPACAGNTPVKAAVTMVSAVHPRVCGEH